ncbi:MAG TPA: sigma 54-interacting transcriptional regulator [Polyangia bacterium]|jgi:transcriptional regulator with PAS, ATPase and Fis domain|nr:sigma 54-interacting transcriptional regulator [Polyangia bacterium]
MRDPAEQTLTAVQSPLSPGEQKDRAVLLVMGSADSPALSARARLQITGDDLFIGRRAEGLPVSANAAVLDDGLVSSQHARLTRGSGGYDLEDLGSKNGTWVDNQRLDGQPGQEGKTGKVRLRDGALIFFGNHVAVFRMVSQIELEAIKAELVAPFGPVATASPALAVACDRLRRLAASEGELLILGETGVGKEVYARAVHQASGRQGKGRFVAINCAAIPRELVESELFGYRQGAHSTAHQAKAGLIEEAEGGTLFLDEIGEMSPEAQIKILRFLQDRELTPLGSTRPRRMDVRIVAATNRIAAGPGKGPGGLRDDIVARLGASPIYLPPLRNRIEDLGALTAHFLGRASSGVKFEQPAFRALALHAWPLNVRELEKIISTAAVLTGGDKPIALRDLPEPIARVLTAPAVVGARRTNGPSPTPAQIEESLRRYEGNVADVSRELGKHRAAVWRWIKKFGLDPQKFRREGQ